MALRNFLVTKFQYAKPNYSIRELEDIKRIMYADTEKGTVYQGSQAMHYNFSKHAPYTCVYDWLANEIHIYLNNHTKETQNSFDAWHENVCDGFIRECALIGVTIEYGLAQKFVNLALKYCYCFSDANVPEALNKFEFAHIALDSFTFRPKTNSKNTKIYREHLRISRLGLPVPFYTETVNPTIDINRLPAWSKLNKTQYMNIQNEMRAYFITHPITYSDVAALDVDELAGCPQTIVLTPFQNEFLIW